ncbi:MAG: cell division protein ZapA [Rectinema sp.]
MNSIYSEKGEDGVSHVVPIELLGVSFSIRTDENPEYIRGLVAELKARYARLSAGGKIVDPLKLAILTNILTLDEMRREVAPKGEAGKEFEASSLLASLDRRLGDLGL